MKNKHEEIDFSSLKAPGSYFVDLNDFSDFLGVVEEADEAAKKLLEETARTNALAPDAPKTKAETEAEAEKDLPSLEELLGQLDELVGLEKIKANVRSLINLVKVRKLREENGLPVPPISLHLVFMGNPGTGKTTVARLIAQLYRAIGVLSKGQLVEVDRSGLVAGFVGQTAIKTGDVIKSALGGVLFIDEAYSLTPADSSGNDFGREAVETILKAMEDNRDDLVIIVAGYEQLMEQFISSNPGLESRFNRYFLFEDYTGEDLYKIFVSMCGKNGYTLPEESEEFAKKHFSDLYETRDSNFGNARDVRNYFENAVSVHADRVAELENPSLEQLQDLMREDLDNAALM